MHLHALPLMTALWLSPVRCSFAYAVSDGTGVMHACESKAPMTGGILC